jgi:hypothetical protein
MILQDSALKLMDPNTTNNVLVASTANNSIASKFELLLNGSAPGFAKNYSLSIVKNQLFGTLALMMPIACIEGVDAQRVGIREVT